MQNNILKKLTMNKEQLIEKINKLLMLDSPMKDIVYEIDLYTQSQTESLKKEIEELRKERFKKPETKQLIDMAILFNEGVLDKEKLSNMLAYAELIIDRLHENGDILIPSSFEI